MLLNAQGDILLTAQQNTSSQKSDGKSRNASIGVGLTVGGSQNGFAINVGAGGSTNKGSGQDSSWNNTHVVAGNRLTLNSGGDAVLRGAQARAAQIVATVGGNLVIESLQDISNYAARDRSGGVQVSLCIPPICYGASSVSGNYGQTKINSQYASVTEQTGMWAGDGGFQLNVGKNTGLIGGVIASSDKAVADGKNVLITGTLTSRDIENRASYEGQSIQLGGGFNFGGGAAGGKDGGKDGAKGAGSSNQSAIGTDNQGNVAGGSKATPGSMLPSLDGLSANVPIAMGASGEASSTTKSAVSGGTIVIRDEAGQKALTGQTAAEAIAALNRDTKDTLNALDRIFDEKEIRAGFEVTKTLAQETGAFLANRAAEAKALKKALDNEPEGVRKEQLRAQYEEAKQWAPGGTYRQVLTAVTLATSGNVTGGAGEFVQAAAVNYLQGLGAAKIKEIAPLLGGEGSAGHIALHALLGCAGAASKSTGCGGGAAGASAGIVVSQLMDQAFGKPASKLDPIEREARISLVTSLLAGMTAVLDPKAVAAVNDAVRLELENNQLALPGAGMAASGGAIAGAGGRGTRPGNSGSRLPGSGTGYELSPTENIALQLARAWSALFGADSVPEEATGPLVTPAVPPGGNTSVPGYPGDSQQAGRTPGYELDRGNLGTPGLQADPNKYHGGSATPLPEQQGPTIILNEISNETGAKATALVSKGADVTPEIIQRALKGDSAISAQDFVSLPAVQRYVDRLLEGDVAPPIKMDGNVIIDGNHRYIAAKILGRNPGVTPGVLSPSRAGQAKSISDVKIDTGDWGNR
ncbi:hemagglutinin repeat-containing protein [Achromobacter sp. NCFB-sbj8-Ac1-l]|uniref:hemagglutinin repeat-containing protein n=1 Tax=unclassified Achromobacter TaxID=2626865 RepID=UPI004046C587